MIRFHMTAHVSSVDFQRSSPIDPSDFFKQIVEIFLNSSVKSATELESIAKAITKLLNEVSSDTAACIAQTLALNRRLDEGMIGAFLTRHDLSTRIVLSEASWLPRDLILGATTGLRRDEAAAITARTDLDLLPLQFLLNRNDRSIDILLAENHEISIPYKVLERLMIRAMRSPDLARALLDRPDLTLAQRGCLVPAADLETALDILQSVNELIGSAERKMPSNYSPDPELLSSIQASKSIKTEFFAQCASAFQVQTSQIERIASDHRGVGLTILLSALGFRLNNLPQILEYSFNFENLNFRSRQFLKQMIEIMNKSSARWLIERMLAIRIDENIKSTSIEELIVSDAIAGEKPDAYKYARQLRIA